MPEPARRLTAPPFDQFEDSDQVFDWGGDDLFTRMPRPRAVDDAPAPRFVRKPATAADTPRALVLLDPPRERRDAAAVDQRSGQGDRRRTAQPAEHGSLPPAEQLGLSVVARAPEPAYRWDETGALSVAKPAVRRTSVITGHPSGVPRPLPIVRAERPRAARTPAEWIGSRPERIVGWAFALGLILILIAISTADAATV